MVNINILKNIIIVALLMHFSTTDATQGGLMETKGNDSKETISLKVISFLSGDEEELNLKTSPESTILDVKNMIAKRTKVVTADQELTFKNKEVAELEDKRTLSYYIAGNSAELCVDDRTKMGDFKFTSLKGKAPIAIKEGVQDQPAANQGLDFRPGLNLIGRCKNANCTALYKDNVIAPKGYSTFNIAKEICETKCPCCQQELTDITTFAFSYCKYTITGRSKQSGKFEHSGIHKDINGHETFLPDDHNVDLDTFYYLEVIVEKLNETSVCLVM